MTTSTHYYAIIPAAGIGARFLSDTPKQYLKILNKTILEWTLQPFIENKKIQQIVLVLNPADHQFDNLNLDHPQIISVFGGKTRAASVFNGLNELLTVANPHDWVIVHDAVRPCISAQDISSLIEKLDADPVGGLYAVPVIDTLKQVSLTATVLQTIARANIYRAQTPQMFRFEILFTALKSALAKNLDITDESQAIELIGQPVHIVLGKTMNVKLTYPEDSMLIENYLRGISNIMKS